MKFCKVLMVITILVVISNSLVFADNSARIQELTTEAKGLIEKQGQYTQAVRQIEARLFEINGAVNELKLQDKPVTTGTGG